MRFIASTKRLAQALKAVGPAVGTRSTLPVLTGVRIEANKAGVTFEATDLEASARYIMNDDVTIERAGQVVTPAKQLAKAVASMGTDEITVESIEAEGQGRVALHAGTRTVTLDAYPVEDFPTMPTESAIEPFASVSAAALADAFGRAAMCASDDEARPVLMSVALFMTKGSPSSQIVATDSYRLGVIDVELDEPSKETRTLLVPARVVKELAKQMRKLRHAARIGLLDRGEDMQPSIAFSFGTSFWTARLIDGEFPNWQQIVPEETGAAVEFEVDEMSSALKSVAAVGNGNETPVRLSLGETTTLALIEGDTAKIRETLATAMFSPDGVGEIDAAFNAKYLADALRFVGGERARMWVRDGLKPALIGEADRRYVLMPVRLS